MIDEPTVKVTDSTIENIFMLLDQNILNKLNQIGVALSKEHHLPSLLEKILLYAKEMTNSDGGTVYLVTVDKKLHFSIAFSDSLHFHAGGTTDRPVPFPDLPLFLESGIPNDGHMVAYAVNHKQTINIKDAYHEQGFDFSGTLLFDKKIGYRTKAVLTIPIMNHEEEVIAVLQLINPIRHAVFSIEDQELAESLASQAGVALTNQLLIGSLRGLFESMIRVIAEAIDKKSPSTAHHSKRVPIVALLLAKAVSECNEGTFQNVHFSEDELYELEVAAFLHDCGKVTTPIHILEKQRKLETVFDRMQTVDARFAALKEKAEKELYQKKILYLEALYPKEFVAAKAHFSELEKEFHERVEQYKNDQEFIARCNENKEPMTTEAVERLRQIELLTPNELENLSVLKGNLTDKEREIIKHHVVMTYRMLKQLHFPKELRQVPEIAASHHERVDGKGYPRGLKKEEMSLQARILAIADIFEALSAPDRSYKEALPLSQVLQIMREMVEEGHLDGELFDVFIKKQAYLPYAYQFLTPEQIDR